MSSTASTPWNENSSFPKFELLFSKEIVESPAWFLEALLVAFIKDYENVADFQKVIKEWKVDEEKVSEEKTRKEKNHRNRVFALFSRNAVALPYLILGLNSVYNKGDMNDYKFLIDVDKAYREDFHEKKSASEGKLTIGDYVTNKVDFSAMLKDDYGICLYAISLFRILQIQNGKEKYPAVTEKDVENFLKAVFENKTTAAKKFFKAIKDYCDQSDPKSSKDYEPLAKIKKPSTSSPRSKTQEEILLKKRAFIENVFFIIRGLKNFQEHLLKFKDFVHEIEHFIEFAKKFESSMMTTAGTSSEK